MLNVECIKIWYKTEKTIINETSFEINENEVVGFLGVNGAGKSTLINTLSDVHGKYSIEKLSFRGKEIKFADENFKLNRYTVFTEEQAFMYWNFNDYISFISKAYGKKIDKTYVDYLIHGFHFEDYINYDIKDLSTGNRKKVFLITGFSLKLPLIILDEPLDGLDFNSSEFLYEVLNGYKKHGSVIMSSHIAESFEKTCDTILLLNNSKITRKKIEPGMDIRKMLSGWFR